MEGRIRQESLLGGLKQVTDPRRRQGKVYPLGGLLGMLILAALNGESSLRGMWLWSCQHWGTISRALGFTGQRRPRSYGTVWYVVSRLDVAELEPMRADPDPAVHELVAQRFAGQCNEGGLPKAY